MNHYFYSIIVPLLFLTASTTSFADNETNDLADAEVIEELDDSTTRDLEEFVQIPQSQENQLLKRLKHEQERVEKAANRLNQLLAQYGLDPQASKEVEELVAAIFEAVEFSIQTARETKSFVKKVFMDAELSNGEKISLIDEKSAIIFINFVLFHSVAVTDLVSNSQIDKLEKGKFLQSRIQLCQEEASAALSESVDLMTILTHGIVKILLSVVANHPYLTLITLNVASYTVPWLYRLTKQVLGSLGNRPAAPAPRQPPAKTKAVKKARLQKPKDAHGDIDLGIPSRGVAFGYGSMATVVPVVPQISSQELNRGRIERAHTELKRKLHNAKTWKEVEPAVTAARALLDLALDDEDEHLRAKLAQAIQKAEKKF